MELKEYWPRYLQDLIEFGQIATAEQPEFTKAVQDVQGAPDDFFLVSLSEYGCRRWEAILGLVAAPGDTLEARRERILIAYLDQLPYTYRALLKYLSTVSDDFQVVLNNDAYELFIRIRLSGYTAGRPGGDPGTDDPGEPGPVASNGDPTDRPSPGFGRRGRYGQYGPPRTPPRRRKHEWHDLSQRSPTRARKS